MAYKDKVEGC